MEAREILKINAYVALNVLEFLFTNIFCCLVFEIKAAYDSCINQFTRKHITVIPDSVQQS